MKISVKILFCATLTSAALLLTTPLCAQDSNTETTTTFQAEQVAIEIAEKEKPELILGTDLVSSYVWRGVYQGAGPSIQPTLGVGYKGLALSAWGSVDFLGEFKELDFTLSYEIGNFYVSLTDYWWNGEGESFYCDYLDSHSLEVGLEYTISDDFPLTLGFYSFVAGNMDRDEETGKRNYSAAFTIGYEFELNNGYGLELAAVVSPWASPIWLSPAEARTGNVQIAAIQATVSKEIAITEKFKLPVSLSVIGSPATDDAHFVAAINF